MCAYGLILITNDVLTPFSPFSLTFLVPIVEGLRRHLKEDLDSHSPSWVGPHYFEDNATSIALDID